MTSKTQDQPRDGGGRFARVGGDLPSVTDLNATPTVTAPQYPQPTGLRDVHTERLRIDEHTEIMDQSKPRNIDTGERVHHQWLIIDGEPVAMLHYRYDPVAQPWALTLCDIEVRADRRGEGFGVRAIEVARERHGGQLMYTTGSYSQAGAAAFAEHLPLLPGERVHVDNHEYTFVHDWDRMDPEYRLD